MNRLKDDREGKSDNSLTRRDLFRGVAAALVPVMLPPGAFAAQAAQSPAGAGIGPLDPAVLPPGIRSRFVDNVNGLRMHVLEAGFETPGRPALLLLHGFPELAYSWRKVMLPLAAAGYHVFAPDVRGYGRTSGTDVALRRRSGAVPHAQPGARHARPGVRVRATARWPR